MHIEQSLYKQLSVQFIDQVCEAQHFILFPGTLKLAPQYRQCACSGFNFNGMPELFMIMGDGDSIIGYDRKNSYSVAANDYEFYPKVNFPSRATTCALGLWNLGYLSDSLMNTQISENMLLVGKIFIRKYQMRLKFSSSDDNLEIYVEKWGNNSTAVIDIVLLSLMLLGLTTFVAAMTRLRMKRFNQQKEIYEKLQTLQTVNPNLH